MPQVSPFLLHPLKPCGWPLGQVASPFFSLHSWQELEEEPGSRNWNSSHGEMLLISLLSMAYSICFLIVVWTSWPGVTLFTIRCALPHQSSFKKMYHRLMWEFTKVFVIIQREIQIHKIQDKVEAAVYPATVGPAASVLLLSPGEMWAATQACFCFDLPREWARPLLFLIRHHGSYLHAEATSCPYTEPMP